MTHPGCIWDNPKEVALAYGTVRGWRLFLASLNDDDDASSSVLDEIGDCAECLRCMVRFLASMASSIGEALAGDRDRAVEEAERQLAKAIGELP